MNELNGQFTAFTRHYHTLIFTMILGLLATATITSARAASMPVANASRSSPLVGNVPLTVNFDGSLSTCPNGCASYVWNFGDPGVLSQTGVTATHMYTFNGVFNATLTVTDNTTGTTSTAPVTVTVNLPPGESLVSYVQACQTQLNFQNIPIPDNISCYSGDLFATRDDFNKNSQVRDFMGYRKITDQVDMVFACRWLQGDPVNNPSAPPISIEMLVNNRSNGNTCFFGAKGFISHNDNLPSATIRSPTSSAATAFWDSPSAVNTYVRCVGCHVEGPYIATPTIAPFLAKYGLLNNGHDTGSNITSTDLTSSFNTAHVKYHAVVTPNVNSVFSSWDSLKQSYMDPAGPSGGCSIGCHVVGTLSPQPDIGVKALSFESILNNPSDELYEINHAQVMPPSADLSDYRWINLSSPATGTGGIDAETFANAKSANTSLVPTLLSNCAAPGLMEAHVVGSDNVFLVNRSSRLALVPDRLSVFNVKDGLTCLNSDQDPAQKCSDYSVQYECTNTTTNARSWVNWPAHVLQSDGDHEERNNGNPCASGSTPTGIQAFFTLSNGWTYSAMGPNDRLASFSQYGLTCNNSDQPDDQCSNYVVRYSSCIPVLKPYMAHVTNVWSGMQLTSSSNANNASVMGQPFTSSWNTQQWAIEPVSNTEYVRLRDTGTNTYLNVPTQSSGATVVTYASNTSWLSEEWIIESIPGSNAVRLKNLWSGMYLTIANNSNFSAIYVQTRNTSWTSQEWVIK